MTYDQPAPAAPAKKSKAKGCAGIGCISVVVFVAVIAIASAVSGSKSTPTASSSNPAAPAATGSTHAAAAPVAAKPRTLLSLKGNGMKNTTQFTTGDNWTIAYTHDCAGFSGGTGNFSVYIDYPNGDIPVNELGAKGASSSTATGAGTHTLKIASECPWTLTVTG
jgi:hypothetical protein